MAPEEIFKYYAKSIGIGGIAMAGIIGIIKSWGIIKSAVGLAAKEMGGKANVEASVKRTQRDISMKIIAIGSIITLLLVILILLLRCDARQLAAYCGSYSAGGRYRFPVYDRGCQCHCHCRYEPGIRHDADDT